MNTTSGPAFPDPSLMLPSISDRSVKAWGPPRQVTLFMRLILVLIIGSVFVFVWFNYSSSPRPSIKINRKTWYAITPHQYDSEVRDLLGGSGSATERPKWPRTLGEFPDSKTEFPNLDPGQRVTWELWRDQEYPDRWVAVAFVNFGEGGRFRAEVVAKKKGGF